MQTSYNNVVARLELPPSKAHFAGIGGVGMAGVAFILREMGWDVSGCDIAPSHLSDWLKGLGVAVESGHSLAHASDFDSKSDMIIRTNAIPPESPEIADAVEKGLHVHLRGVLLAALSGMHDTIAVCGTHGKTTTSVFTAGILKRLRPSESGWCIGGESPYLGAVAGGEIFDSPGKRGLFVAEADESDGTLAYYTPEVTVLNNLDFDHVEYYSDELELENTFSRMLCNTKRAIVYCADHQRATALVQRVSSNAKRISFGFASDADFRISNLARTEAGTKFTLTPQEGASRDIELLVRGRHNVLNATAAIAAVSSIGVDFDEACAALEETAVLPSRRFEKIGNSEEFTVISDYSHHPVEIMAFIETASDIPHERIVAVFQPHRYTRTKTMLTKFPEAFIGIDELVLCPVYCASECLICGGAASDLYKAFRDAAAGNIRMPIPICADSTEEAALYVKATLRPGDLVLVIGAGDVHNIAAGIAAAKPPEKPPMEVRLGAFGTASIAPNVVVVRSVADVQEAVKAGDFTVLSGGTNSFIAPTGCYKTIIRPAGTAFSTKTIVEETEEHVIMDLGCTVQGPSLVSYCLSRGYSGLEFMAGIPGYCGGWLAMNAGTRAGSFCDCVVHTEVVTGDGLVKTIPAAQLGASYRSCPAVVGSVVTKIRIKLQKSSQIAVRIAMDDALAMRPDFSGLRSGGSIFKNPPLPGKSAGIILDEAGCKGLRIGGAYVTKHHANIISVDQEATASDVYALMRMMRERALTNSGILLEPEIRVLS